MPPKARICLCRSQGCADAERKSKITGQTLKGKYLSDEEYHSHQRQEKASKHSGSGPPQIASNSSEGSTLPSSPPRSEPPTPIILESSSNCIATSVVPSPGMESLSQLRSPNLNALPLNNSSLVAIRTQLQQPSEEQQGPIRSLDSHPLQTCSATHLQGARSSVEGPTNQRGGRGVAHWQTHAMRSIVDCRFDFHSWLRADISCDGLVFEETTTLEPSPHLPLGVDILSNMQFIEYEETMLGLLDRIEKINTGADEQCGIAKQNLFSSIEDEIHRLQGLKLHAWKVQVKSAAITLPAPQSGPFREINTGTHVVFILTSLPNKMPWNKRAIFHRQ